MGNTIIYIGKTKPNCTSSTNNNSNNNTSEIPSGGSVGNVLTKGSNGLVWTEIIIPVFYYNNTVGF